MSVEMILSGNAQDGGVPQAGCSCPNCTRALQYANERKLIASLAVIDRAAQKVWMIDATPDFREQLYLMKLAAPDCKLDGILITHAHMGHYSGLIHLGREAMNTAHLPLYGTAMFNNFVSVNAPWRQLVDIGNVELRTLIDGQPLSLSPELSITPIAVPHRGEFSDTIGLIIQGPQLRAFYCPDIDNWHDCDFDARDFMAQQDLAIVDGTFFDEGELPAGRMQSVPHPLVKNSAAFFKGIPAKLFFTHLNHTNPLWHDSPERNWLRENGLNVAEQGQRWEL